MDRIRNPGVMQNSATVVGPIHFKTEPDSTFQLDADPYAVLDPNPVLDHSLTAATIILLLGH